MRGTPKLLSAPKASAYPLQLRDGDLLLVRDAGDADAHAEAAADAAAKTKSPTGRCGRGSWTACPRRRTCWEAVEKRKRWGLLTGDST